MFIQKVGIYLLIINYSNYIKFFKSAFKQGYILYMAASVRCGWAGALWHLGHSSFFFIQLDSTEICPQITGFNINLQGKIRLRDEYLLDQPDILVKWEIHRVMPLGNLFIFICFSPILRKFSKHNSHLRPLGDEYRDKVMIMDWGWMKGWARLFPFINDSTYSQVRSSCSRSRDFGFDRSKDNTKS